MLVRKYSLLSFLTLLVLLLFSWSCSQWGMNLPDYILARVNNEQITADEFNREFRELISESDKETKGENFRDLKKAYLDQMIERKILVQEARRLEIKISQEELNQAILEIKRDYPGEGFGEKLGLKGMSLEEWKVQLEEKLLAEKMIRSVLRYTGKIDEKEALQYYQDYLSSFKVKPRVKARQIIVADGEEAIQILKRLKKGENFEKLAAKKSLGPERVNGGDLGYFGQGERPAEFDQIFSMEVGTISDVIKSPYGYHIFKLEEKIEPRQISFEEAKLKILKELRQKRGEEEYQKWLRGLKSQAKIEINRKWLKS